MFELMCINNKVITHPNGQTSSGDGLIEGVVYTARNEIHIHPNNKKECYLIIELNDLKLISRFIPLSSIDEMELINSEQYEFEDYLTV